MKTQSLYKFKSLLLIIKQLFFFFYEFVKIELFLNSYFNIKKSNQLVKTSILKTIFASKTYNTE